ncbi:MAG: HEAT repeat domain-containing protein [Deltaproteobacteria bacterium]
MSSNFTVSAAETRKIIADFLEMGLADNIIAMFRQDETLYDWTGTLLNDERFMVRMGMVVVFEELVKTEGAAKTARAINALLPLLGEAAPAYVRGEAVTILGLIGTEEAIRLIRQLRNDPDAQVREIVADVLTDNPKP